MLPRRLSVPELQFEVEQADSATISAKNISLEAIVLFMVGHLLNIRDRRRR
jgi:hypothetical protein